MVAWHMNSLPIDGPKGLDHLLQGRRWYTHKIFRTCVALAVLLTIPCWLNHRTNIQVDTETAAFGQFTGNWPEVGKISWKSCHPHPPLNNVDCGDIVVPKDYFNPRAGTATIAFARLKSKASLSKGTVFFNPGGPGGSGKSWIAEINPYYIRNMVGEEYDIIGFDPRGVGETVPQTRCFNDGNTGSYANFIRNTVLERGYDVASNMSTAELRSMLLVKTAEADALLRTQFEICRQNMGEELRYMGTSTVVRDLDFMSKIFDGTDAPINLYGLSYGSVLGQYLANMLPDRVGRVVIDGVVDAESWANQPAYLWHRQWIVNSEATYDIFFKTCSEAGPSICSIATVEQEAPDAIKTRLESFIDGLTYQPLSITNSKHPSILTSGRARKFLIDGIYRPSLWPLVATAFAKAMDGDGSAIMDAIGTAGERDLARAAVSCNDQPHFDAPKIEDIVDEQLYTYQNVSRFIFAVANLENADFGCQHWSITPPERFHGPWSHTLKNPILILSNTADPVTPLASGKKVQEQLGNSSRLLVLDGPGHTSIFLPSSCIKEHMNAYFANGRLPPEGTVCSVDLGPFSSQT
ncbi:Alpha/Beta hydrolase protein [Cristinia sonorae]|uniref:Alpha/Beta hydrolase protein n=1 Tax=Cristinia sonorae TaxID=1940300 RepID=A0A8K0XR46_9AGAR|nr:Alpha/Beta hydrolase protein [Cristinia sonorae]